MRERERERADGTRVCVQGTTTLWQLCRLMAGFQAWSGQRPATCDALRAKVRSRLLGSQSANAQTHTKSERERERPMPSDGFCCRRCRCCRRRTQTDGLENENCALTLQGKTKREGKREKKKRKERRGKWGKVSQTLLRMMMLLLKHTDAASSCAAPQRKRRGQNSVLSKRTLRNSTRRFSFFKSFIDKK